MALFEPSLPRVGPPARFGSSLGAAAVTDETVIPLVSSACLELTFGDIPFFNGCPFFAAPPPRRGERASSHGVSKIAPPLTAFIRPVPPGIRKFQVSSRACHSPGTVHLCRFNDFDGLLQMVPCKPMVCSQSWGSPPSPPVKDAPRHPRQCPLRGTAATSAVCTASLKTVLASETQSPSKRSPHTQPPSTSPLSDTLSLFLVLVERLPVFAENRMLLPPHASASGRSSVNESVVPRPRRVV